MNKHVIYPQFHGVGREQRSRFRQQKPFVLWFTGMSGSGKSIVAGAIETMLTESLHHTYLMDGDNVRNRLCGDLGFGEQDRVENIRRVGEVTNSMIDAGLIVLAAFVSPYRSNWDMVRSMFGEYEFFEVFIDTPIEICEKRHPKGLYKKVKLRLIEEFTGVDSPYEAPDKPDIRIQNFGTSLQKSALQVIKYLDNLGYFNIKG